MLQPLFHERTQGPAAPLGETLCPQEQRILYVQRGLHIYSAQLAGGSEHSKTTQPSGAAALGVW